MTGCAIEVGDHPIQAGDRARRTSTRAGAQSAVVAYPFNAVLRSASCNSFNERRENSRNLANSAMRLAPEPFSDVPTHGIDRVLGLSLRFQVPSKTRRAAASLNVSRLSSSAICQMMSSQ